MNTTPDGKGIIFINGLPVVAELDSRGVAQGVLSNRSDRLAIAMEILQVEARLSSDLDLRDAVESLEEVLDPAPLKPLEVMESS
jgi:hypothetical protein